MPSWRRAQAASAREGGAGGPGLGRGVHRQAAPPAARPAPAVFAPAACPGRWHQARPHAGRQASCGSPGTYGCGSSQGSCSSLGWGSATAPPPAPRPPRCPPCSEGSWQARGPQAGPAGSRNPPGAGNPHDGTPTPSPTSSATPYAPRQTSCCKLQGVGGPGRSIGRPRRRAAGHSSRGIARAHSHPSLVHASDTLPSLVPHIARSTPPCLASPTWPLPSDPAPLVHRLLASCPSPFLGCRRYGCGEEDRAAPAQAENQG